MMHLYHALAWTWGGTPLRSGATGYNIVSGDLSDIGIVVAVVAFFRHRNCHTKGCWRLGHIDPADGHPACRQHHSMRDVRAC